MYSFTLLESVLYQFPLRQLPNLSIPTLSLPTLSLPTLSTLTKWELTKWKDTHKFRLDYTTKILSFTYKCLVSAAGGLHPLKLECHQACIAIHDILHFIIMEEWPLSRFETTNHSLLPKRAIRKRQVCWLMWFFGDRRNC